MVLIGYGSNMDAFHILQIDLIGEFMYNVEKLSWLGLVIICDILCYQDRLTCYPIFSTVIIMFCRLHGL